MKPVPSINQMEKAMMHEQTGFLMNRLLVATPLLTGTLFEKTVIYVTAHGPMGAMGFVLNKPMVDISFDEILAQVGLGSLGREVIRPREMNEDAALTQGMKAPVLWGGPVDPVRGFVLHSLDVKSEETIVLKADFTPEMGGIGLSATLEMMRLLALGAKPKAAFFALGYAGWTKGQLEAEVAENSWFVVEPTAAMLFDVDYAHKWQKALNLLGVDPAYISFYQGSA
jgi:putative transcriptional regulator